MDNTSQQKTIKTLYAFLILSTILSFVPFIAAQFASLLLIMAVLLAAYIYKGKDAEDGLLFNHMTYLIRTIWICSAFLIVGIIGAGLYLYTQGEHSLIHSAANQAANGVILSQAELESLTMQYMEVNKTPLIIGTLVFVGPTIAYFIYRIVHGYSRAGNGYRIANPKSWL